MRVSNQYDWALELPYFNVCITKGPYYQKNFGNPFIDLLIRNLHDPTMYTLSMFVDDPDQRHYV